jgi:hypothetical protein
MLLRVSKSLAMVVIFGTLTLLLCHVAVGPFAAHYGPASALRAKRNAIALRMTMAQTAKTSADQATNVLLGALDRLRLASGPIIKFEIEGLEYSSAFSPLRC